MTRPERGYRNPVIPGFHPDPSVCRVGDEYYLVTSSFTYFPGVPIFRSPNLVDWSQIGNVLDRPTQLDLSTVTEWSSAGIFAPTLRHRDGRFWMITTLYTDRSKNFFVTAEDPAGPWSNPTFIDIAGIDPDLAWDNVGNCWVHYSAGGIRRCRIDDQTGDVLDPSEATWSGTGLSYPEAPHLFERGGTWYLLIAEGGTERGHCISIARGPTPIGPWESCPVNPILSHRSTDHPIQNTGHGDIVDAPDGSSWMVLLGVRPAGTTPGFHVLGRETFLVPVEWVDGWPVVARLDLEMTDAAPGPAAPGPAAPVAAHARDDFETSPLGPQWISVRRPANTFASLTSRHGYLVLDGTSTTLDDTAPAYVGRRQQHHQCRARVIVDVGDSGEAGLTVMMDQTAHYDIAVDGNRIIARVRIGAVQSIVGEGPRPSGPVILRVEAMPDQRGPDLIRLGFEDGEGRCTVVAEFDGRYLSTEVTGGFIGRTIGMFAAGTVASFDWFEYEELT